MMGIAQNHSSSTFGVLNVNTGEIVILQNVSGYAEKPEVRRDGGQAAASRGSSSAGKQMPQPSPEVDMELTTAIPPTTQQPERTVELAEGPPELEGGDESEPRYETESKHGDPGQQTESDDQPLQQTGVLQKPNNTWTGRPSIVLSLRTRSGGGAAVTGGHDTALNVVHANDGKLEHETVAHESATNLSVMKAVLVKAGGMVMT